MNNNTKIMIVFAFGLAIGSLAGLLFAPSEGSEAIRKINLNLYA